MIQATFASPAAKAWLRSTSRARILSIFVQSCNLVRDDGMIISLVQPEIGPGPFSLVIDEQFGNRKALQRFFSKLKQEDSVVVHGNRIRVGKKIIEISQVETWHPAPNWPTLGPSLIEAFLPELQNLLQLHSPAGSLADILSARRLSQSQVHVRDNWIELKKGLSEGDSGNIVNYAKRIAGTGVGLTPAGDDFITGVLFAFWSVIGGEWSSKISKLVAEATDGRTTALSQAWLDAAARGEASQPWHILTDAMIRKKNRRLQDAAVQIINLGSTSGADALTGFVLAASVLVRAEREWDL